MESNQKTEERFKRLENLILLQKKTLTLKEAALYTGYKESYLYKLTASQKIPHSKPHGGAIFFNREELDAWLGQNKVKTIYEIEKEALNIKI